MASPSPTAAAPDDPDVSPRRTRAALPPPPPPRPLRDIVSPPAGAITADLGGARVSPRARSISSPRRLYVPSTSPPARVAAVESVGHAVLTSPQRVLERADERRWALTALTEREEATRRAEQAEHELEEERERRKQMEDTHAEEIATLRSKLDLARAEAADAQHGLHEFEMKIRELGGIVGDREHQKRELESLLAGLKRRMNAWRMDAMAQRERVRVLNGQSQDLSATVRSVGFDRDTLRDGVEGLSRQVGKLEGECSELRNTLSETRRDYASVRESKEDLVRERDSFAEESRGLAAAKTELAAEHAAAAKRVQELESECECLQRQRDASAAAEAAAESDVRLLRQEVGRLTAALSMSEGEHAEELRRGDAIHARKCNDLARQAEEACWQRDRALRRSRELERQLGGDVGSNPRHSKRRPTGEALELRGQVESLRGECGELERELWDRRRASAHRDGEMRTALDDLRGAYDEARSRGQVYRGMVRQATNDIRELELRRASSAPRMSPTYVRSPRTQYSPRFAKVPPPSVRR